MFPIGDSLDWAFTPSLCTGADSSPPFASAGTSPPFSPCWSASGIGRFPLGSASGIPGSFVVAGLRVVGLADGTACLLAGRVGSASTPLESRLLVVCRPSVVVFFFVGWADGAAGKAMYAAAESSEAIDPPSPSPRKAFTVKPTRCPAALGGTASTALHEEPEHALSAGSLPTTPDCVLETS